jgi:hypothetical protein
MSNQTLPTPKFFVIRLEDRKGEGLDVRLPFGVLRMGVKVSSMFSAKVAAAIAESDVDLDKLGALPDDQLIPLLRDGKIRAVSRKGAAITLSCE